MAGEINTRLAGTGAASAFQRVEGEVQGQRRPGRIADDVDRLGPHLRRKVLARSGARRRPCPPIGRSRSPEGAVPWPGRRRPMTQYLR